MIKKRTTVYLEDKVLKMLKLRSIQTEQSVSEYINEIVYQDMVEEAEDLKDAKKALKEPSVPFEEALKELNIKPDEL